MNPDTCHNFFDTGKTRNLSYRIDSLRLLKKAIADNEQSILHALHADLGKGPIEAYSSEIAFVLREIDLALKNVARWIKVKKVKTPLFLKPYTSVVRPEPKGVVLVIGPWNYPFQLIMTPVVEALAAGNCVVMKPSEYAPHTASVLTSMIGGVFDPGHVDVVLGDAGFGRELTALSWDHIFFTGGNATGKQIMEAAAHTLTPVTLELGGKNPCVVFDDAPLTAAAGRIAWGKFTNAGQTCVAPDFVFAHQNIYRPLIEKLTDTIERFYGNDPRKTPDYGRIVNHKHFERLVGLLDDGVTVSGGKFDREDRYIAPTIVTDIAENSPLLTDEIFGPILPVLPFTNQEALIEKLRRGPVPLALYLFTKNKRLQRHCLAQVRSGTACINETFLQVTSAHLPFGGVGDSGMGSYHGKAGFDSFTHYRSILEAGFTFRGRFFYPPYSISLNTMKRILKFLL